MASSFIFIFLSVLFEYFDIVGDIRNTGDKLNFFLLSSAGPRSAVGKAPDMQVRDPGFDTRSGHTFSFFLR